MVYSSPFHSAKTFRYCCFLFLLSSQASADVRIPETNSGVYLSANNTSAFTDYANTLMYIWV